MDLGKVVEGIEVSRVVVNNNGIVICLNYVINGFGNCSVDCCGWEVNDG